MLGEMWGDRCYSGTARACVAKVTTPLKIVQKAASKLLDGVTGKPFGQAKNIGRRGRGT